MQNSKQKRKRKKNTHNKFKNQNKIPYNKYWKYAKNNLKRAQCAAILWIIHFVVYSCRCELEIASIIMKIIMWYKLFNSVICVSLIALTVCKIESKTFMNYLIPTLDSLLTVQRKGATKHFLGKRSSCEHYLT